MAHYRVVGALNYYNRHCLVLEDQESLRTTFSIGVALLMFSRTIGTLLAVTMLLGQTVTVAANPFIILQSTTSTQNSGILDYLLSQFTDRSGITVRAVIVGTGQAIKNSRLGDGDVLLVHSREDEEQFVADGYGVRRYNVMYNDFLIIGPLDDPARVASTDNAIDAFRRIFASKSIFISRGDDSGTHKKELALWVEAKLNPISASGDWYREIGAGMGTALNIANGLSAYSLADRASWVTFGNKEVLGIVHAGDQRLFNQYGVILTNPAKHPHVNALAGQKLIDWLLSKEGQGAIASYQYQGQQLFFPNAYTNP